MNIRQASGDLLYWALSEGHEPLPLWSWGVGDPLWVRWLGPSTELHRRGRTLRRLVRPHFTVRYAGDHWVLTRKDAAMADPA